MLQQISHFNRYYILLFSLITAWFIKYAFEHLLKRAMKKTKTNLDDEIVKSLKNPIFWTVFLGGLYFFIISLSLDKNVIRLFINLITTFAIFLWSTAAIQISKLLLNTYDRKQAKTRRLSDADSSLLRHQAARM